MSELLSGRTAVVTGAASGIGRGIATTFAEHGADVVVADLREEPRGGGRPTHEVVGESGVGARFVECDVTEPDDLEAAVEAAEEFGGIDVMVNNAGVFRAGPFLEATEAEYRTVMDVNVTGVFFGAQAAARRMRERGGGSIVNLSSVAGYEGGRTYVAYTASKGAVRLMTYALAEELGPMGIRVNAIHPGVTETQLTTEDLPVVGTEAGERHARSLPLGRLGTPRDVGNAAVFLASDLAGYVTAESLLVDGGDVNTRGLVE